MSTPKNWFECLKKVSYHVYMIFATQSFDLPEDFAKLSGTWGHFDPLSQQGQDRIDCLSFMIKGLL
jgi:hypothetical protein